MEQGLIRTPYPLVDVKGFGSIPPLSTRAAVRGRCIEKFGRQVEAAQWDHLILRNSGCRLQLDLRDLFEDQVIRRSLAVISAARSVDELAALPFARTIS